VSFFRSFEVTEKFQHTIGTDTGLKFIANCVDAENSSALVMAAHFVLVLHIDRVRSFAQVTPSVVVLHAVDVVDFVRPYAGHVEPRKTVGFISTDENITAAVQTASYRTYFSAASSANAVSKYPRLWVVLQNLVDAFCGKCRLGSSHGDFPYRRGEGWFSAPTLFRPVYFAPRGL